MILFKYFTVAILCIMNFVAISAQQDPEMRISDKIRIKEAIQLSETFGDSIWRGFNKPPFAIILITDEYEFLINHPYPSDDFTLIGSDEILQTKVYYRPQQFNKSFLATFPAVNGVNCIVIGTPENTGLNSTEWIITLLHERFHQYQYTSPNYHQDALALGLSNGDTTGMWQLNYPFPYEDTLVNKNYEEYTTLLVKTIKSLENKNWKEHYKKLMKGREILKESLSENDYRYISFQWYQEGVARYTEYAFLQLLQDYQPPNEVLLLDDFITYDLYLKDFYIRHLNNVEQMKLSQDKRITVYDVGFAESLILQQVAPNWKSKYLLDKFDLEKFHNIP